MAEDALVRLREAALACNEAAKNALAVAQWIGTGQNTPFPAFALPFSRGGTLPGRPGESFEDALRRNAVTVWAAELQKVLDDWNSALGTRDCLQRITQAAVSLHLPPLQIGIDSFATAHEAAHRRASELLYYLQGRTQSLPDEVQLDLRGRIEQEYVVADGVQADLTRPLTKSEIGKAFGYHRNQVDKMVLAKYWYERQGARFRMRVADIPAEYRVKHGLQ